MVDRKNVREKKCGRECEWESERNSQRVKMEKIFVSEFLWALKRIDSCSSGIRFKWVYRFYFSLRKKLFDTRLRKKTMTSPRVLVTEEQFFLCVQKQRSKWGCLSRYVFIVKLLTNGGIFPSLIHASYLLSRCKNNGSLFIIIQFINLLILEF